MQKRIVVLGGAGFIGSHLCLRLLNDGHEVFCIDIRDASNSPVLRRSLRHPGFRYVRHNIVNSFGIRCDELYNLAAPSMVRYNRALPVETLRTSLFGSINALDTARSEHARILFASSGDAARIARSDFQDEAAARCSTHYILGEGKHAAEALHRAYRAEYGVDARIARIYNTYGSGAELMDQRVVMRMAVAALQNRDIQINGSGEQLRTFCWVEEIVDGVIRLMEAPPTEGVRTVELGGAQEIRIRALAEQLVELTGSRSRIVHIRQRIDEAPRRMPDLTAARRDLGWAPRMSLAEGLRRTIDYAERELSRQVCSSVSWAEMN